MDGAPVEVAVAQDPVDAATSAYSLPASPAVEPLTGVHLALVVTARGVEGGIVATLLARATCTVCITLVSRAAAASGSGLDDLWTADLRADALAHAVLSLRR